MKKSMLPLGILLVEDKKRLREQAEQIIFAKEIGISQQSIDKIIAWFSVSKAYYDDMKRRFEEYGK